MSFDKLVMAEESALFMIIRYKNAFKTGYNIDASWYIYLGNSNIIVNIAESILIILFI